jgi:hypothetical protein
MYADLCFPADKYNNNIIFNNRTLALLIGGPIKARLKESRQVFKGIGGALSK